MLDPQIAPINFTLSTAARKEIDNLRDFWNARSRDRADVLMIGWGRTELKSGQTYEHVVVSFYGQSERSGIVHGIQHQDGFEIVYFVTMEGAERFAGKVVDFDRDEGFVLRG